jgi:uncharacterized membrane protein YgaE (UPF0421/DUF939 family)
VLSEHVSLLPEDGGVPFTSTLRLSAGDDTPGGGGTPSGHHRGVESHPSESVRAAPALAAQTARRVAGPAATRQRLATGRARVRTSWWGVVQCAVGGALAWETAVLVLHHPAPFFASVAAIVGLGVSYAQRLRRVLEIALGVAIGVGLGDLLVRVIGRGAWQLGLVVLIAMTAVLLLDGGPLIVNQAALQAVFVVALPPPLGGYVGRWVDALVGGGVALAVAFVAPADPLPALRDAAAGVATTIARALRESAAAARDGDAEAAYQALELGRSTDATLAGWRGSLEAAEEVRLLSPLRRGTARELRAHRRALEAVDHAIRNLRVALRRMVVVVEEGRTGSDRLPDVLDSFAGALFTVPGALRDAEGEGGRRLRAALDAVVPTLDPAALSAGGLSATVVVAQLRSAAIDLYAIVGVESPTVQAMLP